MQLLPPKEGTCPLCATAHEPYLPHNAQSLYYQYRFYAAHGRWPTWQDAVAHCDSEMRMVWEERLTTMGAWTAPPDGVAAIPEDPTGVARQIVPFGTAPVVAEWEWSEE